MNKYQVKPSLSHIQRQVRTALTEDFGGQLISDNDISASLIPSERKGYATITTREKMVVCGMDWMREAFLMLDPVMRIDCHVNDGDKIEPGTVLCSLQGRARALLSAERTALNFLQTLSATATTTAHYVSLLHGSTTKLLDTRKTLPGLRLAQKYAVVCGGGENHRMGLHDAFLIKENHIAACGSIPIAIEQARAIAANKKVEIEVENEQELHIAVKAGADIVMLDNFTIEQIRSAVEWVNKRCKIEVSGNITDEGLKQLAKLHVDYISSGALTKNIQAIDLTQRLDLSN